MAALHELARRVNATKGEEGLLLVVDNNTEPETIVCPQTDPNAPLYVVLCKSLSGGGGFEPEGYPVTKSAELFPPEPLQANGPVAPAHPPLERRADLVITVFNAQGGEVTPFGGDNVLSDGVMADFTGDGHIARADSSNYSVDGVDEARVLLVAAVETPARPLLAVLYNWGKQADWGCEFVPCKEDATAEVRFGPMADDEGRRIDPKVAYRWDAAHQQFAGPKGGGPGDHFLFLGDGADLFAALDTLKGKLPFFPESIRPKSPPSPITASQTSPAPAAPPEPTPPSKPVPVPARFLAGLSDEAILHFFDNGRNRSTDAAEAIPRQPTTITLPPDFWTGPPKAVALALAELNRSPGHRVHYRLAVDDRDGAAPPKAGAVVFHTGSSICYNARVADSLLRFGPGEEPSHFLYLGSSEAGVVFYNVVGSQPAYDLRWCELSADDARQLAAVLWWLDRVRSQSRIYRNSFSFSRVSSTADGHGTLQIVVDPAVSPALCLSGTLWSGGGLDDGPNAVAARWTGNYEPEGALNLAAHLLDDARTLRRLPPRIVLKTRRWAVVNLKSDCCRNRWRWTGPRHFPRL